MLHLPRSGSHLTPGHGLFTESQRTVVELGGNSGQLYLDVAALLHREGKIRISPSGPKVNLGGNSIVGYCPCP
jgi:hypothetical protein